VYVKLALVAYSSSTPLLICVLRLVSSGSLCSIVVQCWPACMYLSKCGCSVVDASLFFFFFFLLVYCASCRWHLSPAKVRRISARRHSVDALSVIAYTALYRLRNDTPCKSAVHRDAHADISHEFGIISAAAAASTIPAITTCNTLLRK